MTRIFCASPKWTGFSHSLFALLISRQRGRRQGRSKHGAGDETPSGGVSARQNPVVRCKPWYRVELARIVAHQRDAKRQCVGGDQGVECADGNARCLQRGAQLAVNLRRVAVKVGDGQWLKKLRQRLQVGPRAALGNAEYDSATVMDDRPKPADSCMRKAGGTSRAVFDGMDAEAGVKHEAHRCGLVVTTTRADRTRRAANGPGTRQAGPAHRSAARSTAGGPG